MGYSNQETQMDVKYIKKCSISLVIRETQIKTTLISHQSERPRAIKQITAHRGEKGHGNIVAGGSANLYCHYRNQCGSVSEIGELCWFEQEWPS